MTFILKARAALARRVCVGEGVRSKKNSQDPGMDRPRNTSGTDPEVVAKEGARHLWDARATVCGTAGKQAPGQDEG